MQFEDYSEYYTLYVEPIISQEIENAKRESVREKEKDQGFNLFLTIFSHSPRNPLSKSKRLQRSGPSPS